MEPSVEQTHRKESCAQLEMSVQEGGRVEWQDGCHLLANAD